MKWNGAKPIVLMFTLFLGVATSHTLFAQTHLKVLDPQRPWYNATGSIDEATIAIRPKGIYMEVDLFLTFSARGTSLTSLSALEVEFFFDLPQDAIITDSWLWFNGEILKAELMDQWSASTIYENIVRRQRDPSILFKRGPGQYELRIYPMDGDKSRKVKITYLVPTHWTATSITAPLPTNLFQASKYPPDDVALVTWPDEAWQSPRLAEGPALEFENYHSPELDYHLRASLPNTADPLSFAVDAPLKEGVYVGQTEFRDESWYQLAVHPARVLDISAGRKMALLIDYDATKTSVAKSTLLKTARSLLHTHLAPTDSFNVMTSQVAIHRASETWLPADSATIDATFDALVDAFLPSYSNLPALLANGIDFINTADRGGTLVLLSSSDQIGAAETANQLIEDLEAVVGPIPPINVVDFANVGVTRYIIGERTFTGNDYFYDNLTRLVGGNFHALRNGASLTQALAASFSALSGVVHAFDLYTTLESGFCYGRFSPGQQSQIIHLDQVVLQTGKCFGSAPFVIETSGLFNDFPFSQRHKVPFEELATSDSTLTTLWLGKQIQLLEQLPQTNDVISQIINYSLDAGVLSMYTAFLAIEPNQDDQGCTDCSDDTVDTDVEDEEPDAQTTTLEAYPNPFSDHAKIAVTLTVPVEASQITVQVYNVMGQVVKTLKLNQFGVVNQFELTWDGTNDVGQSVASGSYFVVLTTPTGRHTISLVLVR